MKNKTARREIESLDYYLQNHTNDYSEKSHTAMMMAIKALETQPCEDAISRKKVLNIITDWFACGNIADGKPTMRAQIKALPSVTPQYTEAEIQKMQEMEQAEIEKAYELGKVESQPCEDCISRQAVLDIWHTRYSNNREENDEIQFKKIAFELPSVTPSHEDLKEAYIKGYDYGVKDWFKAKTENALDHLTDRPCEVCEFHKDGSCSKWNCVFEEKE